MDRSILTQMVNLAWVSMWYVSINTDASFSARAVFCGIPDPNVGPPENGPIQWIS